MTTFDSFSDSLDAQTAGVSAEEVFAGFLIIVLFIVVVGGIQVWKSIRK
jgi:hypothetical protein